MQLDGKQFKQLHAALLSAFPNEASLRLLVTTGMEINLAAVAGQNNLSTTVLDLMEWAKAQGKLLELVEKAYRENPGNPELRAFAEPFLNPPALPISASTVDRGNSVAPDISLAVTSGPIPFDSPFYVRRPADIALTETVALRAARHTVLRGERSGGITSLLNYGQELAGKAGMRVVCTDMNDISADNFVSLDSFWQVLCWYLTESLELETVSPDFWKAGVPANINMERFLRKEVLDKIPEPILWIVAETDRLFFHRVGNRLLAYEVFGLFRSWFTRSSSDREGKWNRLYLLIGSTLDPALFIADGYQSPYNVAKVITLDDFRTDEVAALNRCYGTLLRIEQEQERFCRQFGGIPALSQLGLKLMAEEGLSYDELEHRALHQLSPFDEYINTLFAPLFGDPKTALAAREIANGRPCPQDDTFYRLRSLGIVRGSTHKDAHIRCEFYRNFIVTHLA